MNPFLDSLGHFGLKNIGLPPGGGSGCFQSSQDIVSFINNKIECIRFTFLSILDQIFSTTWKWFSNIYNVHKYKLFTEFRMVSWICNHQFRIFDFCFDNNKTIQDLKFGIRDSIDYNKTILITREDLYDADIFARCVPR